MPNAAKTICPGNGSGCRQIVPKGERCERHKKEQFKGSSKNRSGDPRYGLAAWKRLRLAKLRSSPLCECDDCIKTGAIVAANVVDHIKPLCDYPELFLEWSNLRSMNDRHHNRHTARTRKR